MKQITINFNIQAMISDYDLGKIGEHNATELTITPPTVLSDDQRTAMYRIAFGTGKATVLSESYTGTPIVLTLWQQLTMHARLTLQVIAYDAGGEFIGKSDKLTGFYFNPSVEVQSAINEDDNPDITAEIAENSAARHTHSNKAVLDEIPNYDEGDTGKALVVSNSGLEWDTVESGAVEIWDSGTNSKYTAEELVQMANQHTHFVYKGYPVVAYGNQLVPLEFYFTYITTTITANMNVLRYVCKCKVTSNKKITDGTKRIVPFSVNGQSAGDNGNITIDIPDAQIQPDWKQSDSTKLDYIKHKPATMPPSSHTHTKSDITDLSDGITEKTLELEMDFGEYDGALWISDQFFGGGTEVLLYGNQIASGGLLHNCRITGVEGYIDSLGVWGNLMSLYTVGDCPHICEIPFVMTEDDIDYTIIAYTDGVSAILGLQCSKARIHYIELDGIQPVTPPTPPEE